MELDQLKEMWGDMATVKKGSSDEEIQAMLRKKSKSPIAKMKRNLMIEMIVVIILYTWIIVDYLMKFKGVMLSIPLLLGVLGVLFVIYYIRKRKLLKDMECVTCEVKSNLQQQLTILGKYVRFYMLAGTLLFPLTMIFMCIVLYFYSADMQQMPKPVPFIPFLAVVTIISTVLTIPLYFLNKWYVRKLYGQHIENLKLIVNEMSEEEN
jgi:amino acid transporter